MTRGGPTHWATVAQPLIETLRPRSTMTAQTQPPTTGPTCPTDGCCGTTTRIGDPIPEYWPDDTVDLTALRWQPVHDLDGTWMVHAETQVDGKPGRYPVTFHAARRVVEHICDLHNATLERPS